MPRWWYSYMRAWGPSLVDDPQRRLRRRRLRVEGGDVRRHVLALAEVVGVRVDLEGLRLLAGVEGHRAGAHAVAHRRGKGGVLEVGEELDRRLDRGRTREGHGAGDHL